MSDTENNGQPVPPRTPRRWRRWVVGVPLTLGLVLLLSCQLLIDQVGGAFDHEPEALEQGLSTEARTLMERALAGLPDGGLVDVHCHAAGIGASDSGAYVNPAMLSWWHPIHKLKFKVYLSAAGVRDLAAADALFVERLARLIRGVPGHGVHHLLAFDQHYRKDGTVDPARTEFHVPNAWVVLMASKHPDVFVPALSIHPYRSDAVEALTRWAATEPRPRIVKWLPNAMGIDPDDPRCDAFYAKLVELKLILLSHTGEEQAVKADEAQAFGNPLKLRRALKAGVTVIMAHCASLGTDVDTDDPARPRVPSWQLALRLLDETPWVGRLFGEISATTQYNRMGDPLRALLERDDLHARLVNGSDYPLPAINALIQTRVLKNAGYITAAERRSLNEIYDYNPLLFDLVLKRTLRHPTSGQQFAAATFGAPPALGLGRPQPGGDAK